MSTLNDLFYQFFTAAKYYSFSTDQLCKSIVPIHLYEKAYYKYKDPKIRENMAYILNAIIQIYCEIDYKKCSMCDDLGVYCYLNNNGICFCYKHAPSRTMKILPKSPFYFKRKPINNYDNCMNAFIYYADKTKSTTIDAKTKLDYRVLARCYACLSTYMDDAPVGVYPKSYKKSEFMIKQKEPEIYINAPYQNFVLNPKHIDSRENWKKLHQKDKLFQKS